jgi:hypothetical protein
MPKIALPMRIDRLKERSLLDDREDAAVAREEAAADRLLLALELSDLTRDLAESAAAPWLESGTRLEEKARLYVSPLRAAAASTR